MDKRNIMLTAVIILGIMLAGITGYLVWSTVHDRYVKAEDIGAFKDSAPDMGVPGGSGQAGRWGQPAWKPGRERTLGQQRAMEPCIGRTAGRCRGRTGARNGRGFPGKWFGNSRERAGHGR